MLNNEKFFTYEILVTDDKMIRKGDGYKYVEISLNDIGKIKNVANGALVFSQEASHLFKVSKYKKIGIYDDNIIWIPCIIHEYKDLIDFLKSQKEN